MDSAWDTVAVVFEMELKQCEGLGRVACGRA